MIRDQNASWKILRLNYTPYLEIYSELGANERIKIIHFQHRILQSKKKFGKNLFGD